MPSYNKVTSGQTLLFPHLMHLHVYKYYFGQPYSQPLTNRVCVYLTEHLLSALFLVQNEDELGLHVIAIQIFIDCIQRHV